MKKLLELLKELFMWTLLIASPFLGITYYVLFGIFGLLLIPLTIWLEVKLLREYAHLDELKKRGIID